MLTGSGIYGSAKENVVGFNAHPDYCFSFVFSVIKRGEPLPSHWTHLWPTLWPKQENGLRAPPPPMTTTKILGRHFVLEGLLWQGVHWLGNMALLPTLRFWGTHTTSGDRVILSYGGEAHDSPFSSSDHVILSPEVQNINHWVCLRGLVSVDWTKCFWGQGLETFPEKGQVVNASGFGGHTVHFSSSALQPQTTHKWVSLAELQ